MSKVKRIYVEKKAPYAVGAMELLEELQNYLDLNTLKSIRVLIRYDIENVSEATLERAFGTVFSEPPVDILYKEEFSHDEKDTIFSVEYLPGQFDQRADSAEQCIKLLNEEEEPVIKTAVTYVLSGELSEEELNKVKNYCINPVDQRETGTDKPVTLTTAFPEPEDVKVLNDFTSMDGDSLSKLYDSLNLAMTINDFVHIQNYFKEEERDPSMTEIKVLDTYWSDHCRHTTFLTELKHLEIEDGFYKEPVEKAYNRYVSDREALYKGRDDKYICLMDIALMAMRKLRAEGKLDDMEVSDEINACSIVVPVEIDGKEEEWLVFFKNETHNHPTEIEPFGGAATCLGGAIRDPLSGRGYVYQAMRVTGAADPRTPIKDTLKGKLPQRKIVTGAASGYSSYGNQIGLATGLVDEIYHPNYVAKRMEIGAVMGAAPRKNVVRLNSEPGDIILLLGGRTGRDGLGGATGSSKVHTQTSIETCGAEVQKGNPPTERKLQRLFRREEVSKLIKKCNDFGAGGVSVAIGELADGLLIDLDKVPKKYAGLDGTELAISESQERMAIVVDKGDVEQLLEYANEENLEAVEVAVVTEEKRLVMNWRGREIVNISRAFLDTNGAHEEAEAYVELPKKEESYFNAKEVKREELRETWLHTLSDLNVCSKKGLNLLFDSSIGAITVTMPFGGKKQLTPVQTMISKLPVLEGECNTITRMSYGYDPYLSSWSPYHGSIYAVLSSTAKIVATGGDYKKIRFTFQEYFKRLGNDKKRWGEPVAALLGAYEAQMGLGLPSIGGKDSMSGTFQDLDVPPTLVSFAVNTGHLDEVVSPELKEEGNVLVSFHVKRDEFQLPDFEEVKKLYEEFYNLCKQGVIKSAYGIEKKGIGEAVSKMAFGNGLGVIINEEITPTMLFSPDFGSLIAEVDKKDLELMKEKNIPYTFVGTITKEATFKYDDVTIGLEEAQKTWEAPLESVFPTSREGESQKDEVLHDFIYREGPKRVYIGNKELAKPKVFIPVFPGTNCEYDSKRAFLEAGANVETICFKNMTPDAVRETVRIYEKAIKESNILMFPGGFSAGDEPDGSGKFIATAFRNERLKEAVTQLLEERDGLILGICNGFQALIKLGLVPYGKITPQKEDSPTLTTNHIGRHIAKYVHTKVVSNRSPWLKNAELGGVYTIPTSHGEGRFVASKEWIDKLVENGQVATRYVNANGTPTMSDENNPNGSYFAIEGITSPCGKVLGKMTHSERIGRGVGLNITGNQNQHIFKSGVEYFK